MIIKTALEQLPANIRIVDNNGMPTQAFVFYLLKMFKRALNDEMNFDALQAELNSTQTGAGLSTDGSYSPDLTANYTSTATSLFTADTLLDLALHYLQTEVNNVETGAGLNADGTYTADALAHYIALATGLKNADSLLDAQLFSTQSELDTAEAGAGLNTDGTYTANGSAHYISAATSLKDADNKLDSKLYDIIQRVVSITADYTVPVGNYSVIADATAGNVIVTLPLASTATAFIVGVTKTDTTANTVTIARSGTDTIAGDTSQVLTYDKEVFNFVSDGTNWQLAN